MSKNKMSSSSDDPNKKSKRIKRTDENKTQYIQPVESSINELKLDVPTPLVISIFAHKGGVGKTTMTLNVAKTLLNDKKTHHNVKRILLIDADPQMNLTHFVLNDKKFDEYSDYVANKQIDKVKNSIMNLFVRNQTDIPPHRWVDNGAEYIDVLCGSFENSSYMAKLSMDVNSIKNGEEGGTAIFINQLINNMKQQYDMILIDLNPSLNPLNQVLLRNTNIIFQILSPDSFSRCGLKLVKTNLYSYFLDGRVPIMGGLIFNKCFIRKGENARSERSVIQECKQLSKELFNTDEVIGILQNMHARGTEMGEEHKCIIDYRILKGDKQIASLRYQILMITRKLLQKAVQLDRDLDTDSECELEADGLVVFDRIDEELKDMRLNSQE